MTEVKTILDVKLFPVEYKTDDTMQEGDVHINFDGGGVHFSENNIMRHITDICNELTQHYFVPYPEEKLQE